MSDQTRELYEAVAGSFSIWDAAHIFEYAASRFTAIHLTQLAKPNPSSSYKYSFVKHLIWEAERFVIPFTEHDNLRTLFDNLQECAHDENGDAARHYWVVPRYRHCWWTTAFHFQNINMPLQFLVAEVKELVAAHFKQRPALGLLILEPITHPRKDDPLLQQLHALQSEVARLGLDLGQMLVSKLEATGATVDAMNRLEQPLDEVYDTMAASQVAVDVLAEDYANGRIGTSPRGDPFPEVHPFYLATYHQKLAALDLDTHPTSFIPRDWALNAVDIASEWVEQQFAAHVAGRPLIPEPQELDPETILACGHLAFVLTEAYQHPIQLDIDVIWYNEALMKRES
ncbi:hypothetical protein EV424DRAFT_1352186 [Suillus variegatus]|nr:hypothetical protein EV424DRAFT_1352186 [Suillus variegatus]